MAHFAQVESDIITTVIVAEQEHIDTLEGTWVETSYDGSTRKQYAGKGFTYDAAKDKFIQPQPYPSWSLDGNDDWQAPIAYPDDGKDYNWDEATTNWVEVE